MACLIGCVTIIATMAVVVISKEYGGTSVNNKVRVTRTTGQTAAVGDNPAVTSKPHVSKETPKAPVSMAKGTRRKFCGRALVRAVMMACSVPLLQEPEGIISERLTSGPTSARSTSVIQMMVRFCCQRGCDMDDLRVLINC